MMIGGVTVPCFPTNSSKDNKFIIKDCKPKLIVLENEAIYEKNKEFIKKIPKVK